MTPRSTRTPKLGLALGLTLALLAGCGGGGGGGVVAGGGVGGTGISSGTVTGIGSVWVNGVRHDTDTAALERNGTDVFDINEFRVGDVVLVEWTQASGSDPRVATSVRYAPELIGEVTSDPTTIPTEPLKRSLGVMGQTVIVGAETVFDSDFAAPDPGEFVPADLLSGVCVEVTGFRRLSDSALVATRVELINPCPAITEVQGVIVNTIGSPPNLVLDVSGTTVDVDNMTSVPVGAANLQVGDFVEVRGSFSMGRLDADVVDVEDPTLSDDDGVEAEIEGLIANASGSPPTNFTLSGVNVVVTGTTVVENGMPTDLVNDLRVEVEGSFNAIGDLVAEEIEIRPDNDIELEASVAGAPDTVAGSLDLRFGADTVRVNTDGLTQFTDTTGSMITPPFDLADLVANHHVEVVGYLDEMGDLIATRISLLSLTFDSDRDLKGPPSAIADPTFDVLGVTVDTSGWASDDFDPDGRAAFFSALAVSGTIVEVDEADEIGGAMDWSGANAEIEND
jgi:hypothetical protein